ncbi:MAG: monovalent cation/H(+) antiporter subunit G [Candidatus Aenigmatarchaeota archaeon]|nr:MAG: monovalent cation/H(+) antiporter subunit G [Candidatus Aenigmarchaeota archaeon]
MIDIVVQVMLYISGIFAVIGSLGLIRFPDFYTRTHAATMLSVGSVSLGLLSLFIATFWSVYTLKIFVIIVFNLFTNPTATHAIAERAYKIGITPKKLVKDEMKT